MRVLLTGAAGFIGFHCSQELMSRGHEVFGYDSINDYYDPRHKHRRLEILKSDKNFHFLQGDICDQALLAEYWQKARPTHVLHLAAQAGVRYSLENPMAYIQTNIVGFQNIIELVRHRGAENFVYASSSSVYGGNKKLPFDEGQMVNNPISLYAASKAANELVANTYCHLYKIPATGVRFFTVYGTCARPDMAMFKFARAMVRQESLPVYNNGKMLRDFTYVDDIVAGVLASLEKPEHAQIYNLGCGRQMNLMTMIELLEKNLGKKAKLEMMPMQAGDVEATLADVSKARKNLGFEPKTNLEAGVEIFAKWFLKDEAKFH